MRLTAVRSDDKGTCQRATCVSATVWRAAPSTQALCRLPAPATEPGLIPKWANTVLDSHQKHFADECAICFSEIQHDFRVPELCVKAEECDDVASAGTVESDDFAACSRPAMFVATSDQKPAAEPLNEDYGYDTVGGLPMGSPARSDGSGGCPRDGKAGTPVPPDVVADDRDNGDGESLVRIDDGRSPDIIAEEIMKQPPHLCTKEQLELLYKTCRCVTTSHAPLRFLFLVAITPGNA